MDPSLLDPTRMVHLSVHLTAVVVIAAYSAALISYLAIKTFVMPFTTMEGLLEDGTYRFAVTANSADYSFFQVMRDCYIQRLFVWNNYDCFLNNRTRPITCSGSCSKSYWPRRLICLWIISMVWNAYAGRRIMRSWRWTIWLLCCKKKWTALSNLWTW